MLDFVILEIILNPLGYEVFTIVRDDCMRDHISGNDIVPDEFLHCHGCDCLVGNHFHPLGEVVNRHKDIAMTIGGSRMYSFDDVDSPCREGPWRRHAMQLLRGSMDEVPMDLAIMASVHKLATICLHGRPKVALKHDFLG